MPDTKRINFLGLPLDATVSAEAVCGFLREKTTPRFITFINPGAWALAKKSPAYLNALNHMSFNLADGQGVALVCRWLTGLPCPRTSFDMTSLADPFFRAAIAEKASIMLIGGKPGVDENVHGKLLINYPGINIVGTEHGYGDFEPKIKAILAQSPDVVITGMGTPRQENFLLALKDAGYQGLAITCGGFFDQYLEADPYYPRWIDQWNLRFAYRLYREPERLWRRYLIDYPFFIGQAAKAFVDKYRPAALKRS